MMTQRPKLNYTISADALFDFSFIMFFSSTTVAFVVRAVLRRIGLSGLIEWGTLLIIYVPLLVGIAFFRKKIKLDIVILFLFIISFFGGTLLFHPEYETWYRLKNYGVWNYVLKPDNGIYAYLFIRVIDDPKRAFKNLRIASWLSIWVYLYRLRLALATGYWEMSNVDGTVYRHAYNLAFGYDVLFFALVFLYSAIKDKHKADYIGAAITVIMILLGGSRGPFLCIGVFLLLIYLTQSNEFSRRTFIISAVILLLFVLIYAYRFKLALWIAGLLQRQGHSARFLNMLLSGSITSDSGRQRIWNTAIQMIKEKPLGYGAMGTRHVISNIIDVGHPHQVFLEILVDFGVIIGGGIIIWLLSSAIKIIANPKAQEWRGIFIIFFCRALQLLMSGTFWHVAAFWGCIGIGVNYYLSVKSRRLSL